MKKFWIRTASAVAYVALFVGTMYSGVLLNNDLAGRLIFMAFLLFVAVGCTFEYFRMVKKLGAKPIEWLGYLATIAVVLFGCSLHSCYAFAPFAFLALVVPVVMLILLFPVAAIIRLWGRSDHPFGDIGHTIVPVFYVGLPLGIMGLMQGHNPDILMLLVVLVWINDACAYMGGSLLGKHKMWERHSPGKTWEGTAIGVLLAMVAGALACYIWQISFTKSYISLHWWQGAMLGLVCGVIGTLGDLVESMLKRHVGVKDSGRIMPGHGGFLDRFDSLLILTPLVLVLLFVFGL